MAALPFKAPVNVGAVTVPGKLVLPLASNKVAVRVSVVNVPEY